MPKLVTNDGEAVREFQLKHGDTLGRTSQNAIALEGNGISRTHCKFTEEKGAWFVEDQGSSNGTLVNKRRVTKFELADGDVLTVGEVECRFLVGGADTPVIEDSGWGEDDLSIEEKHFLVLAFAGRWNEVVMLPEGRLTVGRNARHALVVKRGSVSGDHAEVVRSGSSVTLRDLGSSNGTSVDGAKVVEAQLNVGAEVRFGDALCIYGRGDPKDFSVEAVEEIPEAPMAANRPTAGGTVPAATAAGAAEGHWNDDAAFTLHQNAGAGGDRLWTIISILAVLAVGGGGAWFFMNYESEAAKGSGAVVRHGANLLPESIAGFESGMDTELPAWAKVDEEDPADVAWEAIGNNHVLSISRGAKDGITLVACSNLLPVSGGNAWDLAVDCSGDGQALVGVRFGTESREKRGTLTGVFAHEFVGGAAADLNGRIVIPDGATMAQVVVGLRGEGDVRFDGVHVVAAGTADPAAKSGDFSARLASNGTLRLSRLGARVVDLADVVHQTSNGWISSEERGATLQSTCTGDEQGLHWTVQSPDLGAGGVGLLLPAGDSPLVLIDGERGRRISEACTAVPASALVLGTGGNRIRISLSDESGAALRVPVSFAPDSAAGQARVLIAAEGRSKLRMDVTISFAAELANAVQLRTQAREAARNGESGKVQLLCARILERFPYDEDMVRETQGLLTEHTARGRKFCDDLTARVDDALFFRDWKKAAQTLGVLTTESERYAGTAQGEELRALRVRLTQARDGAAEPERRALADALLARAKDYMELGRESLATAFLKSVTERFAGTDAADEAVQLLAKLAGKGAH